MAAASPLVTHSRSHSPDPFASLEVRELIPAEDRLRSLVKNYKTVLESTDLSGESGKAVSAACDLLRADTNVKDNLYKALSTLCDVMQTTEREFSDRAAAYRQKGQEGKAKACDEKRAVLLQSQSEFMKAFNAYYDAGMEEMAAACKAVCHDMAKSVLTGAVEDEKLLYSERKPFVSCCIDAADWCDQDGKKDQAAALRQKALFLLDTAVIGPMSERIESLETSATILDQLGDHRATWHRELAVKYRQDEKTSQFLKSARILSYDGRLKESCHDEQPEKGMVPFDVISGDS